MYYLFDLVSQNNIIVSSYILEKSDNQIKVKAKIPPYYVKEPKIIWEKVDDLRLVGSIDTFLDTTSSPTDNHTATIQLKEGYIPIFVSKKGREIDNIMRISKLEEISSEQVDKIMNSIV